MSQYLATGRAGSQRSVYPIPTTALPIRPYVNTVGAAYVRPADWTAIPSLTPGTDKKIYILAAIFNDISNQFALTCAGSAGYTVDWGDGLGTVNYATNVQANYNISYANVSSGTLTTRGYRQALITITPQGAGTLTDLNLNKKNSSNTTAGVPANNWLEVAICSAALTSVTIGGTTGYSALLEKVNFVETGTITTMSSVFSNCWSLQSVNAPTNISSTASLSNCFTSCYSLRTAPSFSTVTSPSSMTGMFQNCFNLIDAGTLAATNTVDISNMFNSSYSLVSAPSFDRMLISGLTSTFQGCASLRNVGNIYCGTSCGMNAAFSGCSSLKTAPYIRFPTTSTNCGSMFATCVSLTTVPAYDLSNVSQTGSMFATCTALESLPAFNFSSAPSFVTTFNGCRSLRSIGTITTTSALTSLNQTFLNCNSLINAPVFTNTSAVTDMASTFQGCTSLTSVPALSLGAVTTFASTFQACNALTTAPNITMSASSSLTTTASMFASCLSLTTVPNYTFSWAAAGTTANQMFTSCISLQVAPTIGGIENVITLTNVFNGCSSLREVPAYNINKATSIANMFTSCLTLQQAPAFTNTANVISVNATFSGCGSLTNLPAYNLNGVSSAVNYTSFVLNCNNLARSTVANVRFSHSYINCKLGNVQLDEIYTNLPTITAQTITVTNNWGTATDTPAIATAKGWTVTG